jgi:hypothetical protein
MQGLSHQSDFVTAMTAGPNLVIGALERFTSGNGTMSRKLAITIAVVSSLTGVASSAVAGQAVSDRNHWPNGFAANRAQLNAASAGPLSAFAFDSSGSQRVVITNGGVANRPYQGGPHPR